jgi:hypothetical protein
MEESIYKEVLQTVYKIVVFHNLSNFQVINIFVVLVPLVATLVQLVQLIVLNVVMMDKAHNILKS